VKKERERIKDAPFVSFRSPFADDGGRAPRGTESVSGEEGNACGESAEERKKERTRTTKRRRRRRRRRKRLRTTTTRTTLRNRSWWKKRR
jgi:hypothetical protein